MTVPPQRGGNCKGGRLHGGGGGSPLAAPVSPAPDRGRSTPPLVLSHGRYGSKCSSGGFSRVNKGLLKNNSHGKCLPDRTPRSCRGRRGNIHSFTHCLTGCPLPGNVFGARRVKLRKILNYKNIKIVIRVVQEPAHSLGAQLDGGCRATGSGWRETDGSWRVTEGGGKVTDGWKVADSGWRVTDGGWRVTESSWRVSDGGWRVTDTDGGPRFSWRLLKNVLVRGKNKRI